ncbi:MAG: hypothetical protein GY944_11915 [bacterium]|nr:hypothetical protein [bacterium]MCP5041726.1 hypothetical protein [bacterium]
MNRRTIVIATFTALFGLFQGPLCGVACLDGGVSTMASDVVHQAESDMPCHAAATQDDDPSEQPASHEECGCEGTSQLVLSLKKVDVVDHASAVDFAPKWVRSFEIESSPREMLDAFDVALLGSPPDILLMKSTLLI